MQYSYNDILNLNHSSRLKLINGITGIKSANLIGTKSHQGHSNLAIFSSVVHLGSNPPLLGFVLRPQSKVRRHTYENILESGYYTINHIHHSITEKAHYTSTKFEEHTSEFSRCNLTEEYINGFQAPYVKESQVKIGLQFVESINIQSNDTTLVVGQIEFIHLEDELIDDLGYLNLEKAGTVGIGGLNSYYKLQHKADYPYARLGHTPEL